MAFTQNGSIWTGTEFKDIGTFVNQNSVIINALGGDDQATLQSSTDSATSLTVSLGAGADRLFVTDSSTNAAEFALINSFVDAGDGDDIIFGDDAGTIQQERTPFLQGSTLNGNTGNDIIRLYGAISGSSFTSVNGNKGADAITLGNTFVGDGAFARAANPDRYDSAQINGGQDNDTFFFDLNNTNVVGTSINGNLGNDFFTLAAGRSLSGNWERTTIYGGQGDDNFQLATNVTSSLLVYGDRDNDSINLGTGRDTIYGGQGNDTINGGDGANLIFGETDNDTITTSGIDSSTVYGGDGNDVITDGAGRSFLYGDAGNDRIVDGVGSDFIYAGTGADAVRLDTAAEQDTILQNDGDGVAATGDSETRDGVFRVGTVITFANGVDAIRNFAATGAGEDVLDTTLGDTGLDSTTAAGQLYAALGLRIADGLVANRSYYLSGNWNGTAQTFTVTANNGGADTLVYTQGNNGPIGTNANALLLTSLATSTDIGFANII